MADVVVEKDQDRNSNSGLVVGIIAVVILVLAALFVLPGLMNNGTTTTPAPTPTTSTTPAQ